MTRRLALGLLLVATMPAGPAAAQSGQVWLLQNDLLRDQIAVGVAHQPEQVLVDVRRWSAPNGTPLPDMAIQAWILKSDGTALSRSRPEQKVMTWGRRSDAGTGTTWRSTFSFAPADQRDLAAVVVSVDGTLFVRAIPQKPTK
jgi:hypothetical protein